MNHCAVLFAIFLTLTTPLVGLGARELRNQSPKELIAQLLLRRSQSASKSVDSRPAPANRPSKLSNNELVAGDTDQEVEELAHFLTCSGPNCEGESFASRWTMPLMKLGDKQYYLGIFFKANWYKAAQYCRFHGMHLAGIEDERENRFLEQHIQEAGLGHEHFWTSGTDQGEEGRFFWMSNGRPVTFTNWNAGEPNNFEYENGEQEHCLELWNRDGKGLKWNDSPCSFETFFICEVA
ncbi:C-type lectin 37Db-like isoform X1 [Macrobrachium nipponense]|uniref:C-type lectin 37Db-like isoform X1 n=1 Tax=Macrobrachium nipponense TaxID=159736 RepID=UPI0030C8734D